MHRTTSHRTRPARLAAGLAAVSATALVASLGATGAQAAPAQTSGVAQLENPLQHDEEQVSRQVWRAAQDARQLARQQGLQQGLEQGQAAGQHEGLAESREPQRSEEQGRPGPTGPGRQDSAEVVAALEAGMASMVADGAVGVTARVQAPHLTWGGAAGVRDQGRRAPAGAQDRFRAASNTKTMVATLVLQEVQAGSWQLDTRVEDVIPGLFPDHPEVTIRQLLNHTSGAPNGTMELMMRHISDPGSIEQQLAALSRDYTDQEHIDAVNDVPWTEPGEFVYSNAGYVALGMLLEEQTGRDVADLLRQRVFTPAGMRHSTYPDDPGVRGPFLREDAWIGPGWEDGWLDLDGFDPDVFAHAGAVVSTSPDLTAFNEALLTGELVDTGLLQEMLTPVGGGQLLYGLGIYAIPDPCSDPAAPELLWGHDGASFGTLSIVLGSTDGTRQVAVGASGRDLTSLEGRWSLGDVLVPALLATC